MPLLELHPAYRQALGPFLGRPPRAPLSAPPGLERVEAQREGATLEAIIDPATHTLVRASHRGAEGVNAGVLEALCELIEGLPIQEASDHGILHLEAKLRDPRSPAPVPGLLVPEKVDPAFALAAFLLHALREAYRVRTGYADTRNGYAPKPRPEWRALPEAEQMAAAERVRAGAPWGEGVRTLRVDGATRVVVTFETELSNAAKEARLMAFEHALRETLEPTLRIYLEPKVDENKLRSMKGVRLDP